MKGDFSRWKFDKNDNYSGVLHQQGKVLLDSDWNERTRITNSWQDENARDVIGPRVAAVPADEPDGFKVGVASIKTRTDSTKVVKIGILPGRVWADGILAYLDKTEVAANGWVNRTARYLEPPLMTPGANASSIDADIRDAVILEVWREALNGFQVPDQLLEPALGGPDTTERHHTAYAFRLLRLTDPADNCYNIADKIKDDFSQKGKLRASLQPTTETDGDCPVVAAGGYTGFEHHLYRVEIAHTRTGAPMFKWSRFNGGLVGRGTFKVDTDKVTVDITANMTAIATSGLPSFYLEAVEYSKALGHWRVTYGAPATIDDSNVIHLPTTATYGQVPDSGESVFFRLWDGIKEIALFPPYTASTSPVELENGIRLEFDTSTGNTFKPGDYWLFEVKAGEIQLPALSVPVFQIDTNVDAIRTALNGNNKSPQLLAAFDSGGFPISINASISLKESQWYINDTDTGEAFIVKEEGSVLAVYHPTLINTLPPEGIRYHRVPLAILNWDGNTSITGEPLIRDCRRIFHPLTDLRGCCTVTVGEGGDFNDLRSALDFLPEKGGKVCLFPGIHQANVEMVSRENIHIIGCGQYTIVHPSPRKETDPIFTIRGSRNIKLENMTLVTATGTAIEVDDNGDTDSRGISIRDNHIFAYKNAVAISVFNTKAGGNHISISRNCIGMLDIEGGGVGIGVAADDVLIQENRIVTVPAVVVLDDGDPRAPDAASLAAFKRGTSADVLYQKDLVHDLAEQTFMYVSAAMGLEPKAQFSAGGIQIRGGSDDIRIIDNLVIGGVSNGISFGGNEGSTETIAEITIAGNRIRWMKMSGIGPTLFSDFTQGIPNVENLMVYRNVIQHNAWVTNANLYDNSGAVGGIAMSYCEDLFIHDNRIENNGETYTQPVCGIYIYHGENLDISRNRIINNGPLAIGPDNTKIQKGLRGGILIKNCVAFNYRDLRSAPVNGGYASHGNNVDDAAEVSGEFGVPALKVHDNVVMQPFGHALRVNALGAISIIGNRFTTRDIDFSTGTESLLGAAVYIFNLGKAQNLYGLLISFLYMLKRGNEYIKNPEFDGRYFSLGESLMIAFLNLLGFDFSGGNTMYCNNQTTLELRGKELQAYASAGGIDLAGLLTGGLDFDIAFGSQFIFSLDDVSYIGNQSDCNFLLDLLLTNTTILAVSTRVANNRFKEGMLICFLSLLSVGMINTTCDNQATHCIVPLGTPAWLERHHNTQLFITFCLPFAKMLAGLFGIDLVEDEYRTKAEIKKELKEEILAELKDHQ